MSTDVARILENNRFIYRPCKWEELGWLPLVDTIRLSTFTGSGYPEKSIVRGSPRDVSVNYAADEFHINSPEHYAQVANIVQFSWVRMAGVLKIHLHPILISSKAVNPPFEFVKFTPRLGKTVLVIVSEPIRYLLFRGYSLEQSMIDTATTAVKLEGSNLVSEDTLTRKRNEAGAARERARVLRTDAAVKRLEADWLQKEEERLGDQANDLDKAVVDIEWQEPMLERKIAALQKTHDKYLRDIEDTKSHINMYRAVILCRQDRSAGLRRNVERKKGEADRLRQQAGQDCMSGIDHRVLGNVAQANLILHQVEELINEADQLDREAQEHINHIERNDNECQALNADIVENGRYRGELMGNMANSELG